MFTYTVRLATSSANDTFSIKPKSDKVYQNAAILERYAILDFKHAKY